MKENSINKRTLLVPLMLAVPIAFIGCGQGKTTPPGPVSSFGVVYHGAHCTYVKWEEGLAVMFLDRMSGHSGHGSSSTEDALHRHRGSAKSEDGTGYEWELTTTDGRTGSLEINGTPYDLSEGALFAIQVEDKQLTVHQLENDISQLGHQIEDWTKRLRRGSGERFLASSGPVWRFTVRLARDTAGFQPPRGVAGVPYLYERYHDVRTPRTDDPRPEVG